ncbi:MAG TPA: beta-ketoacyl synthase N-terminal-like domain-containing protein [Candidatus Margulisiibacteriota bacterium]|nr:beta-ketoacyl synthase N-terminal-like domain-containing protein [Candidatus Margulisiibacteriota bacterium]
MGADATRVTITGAGAICGAGKDPDAIWEVVRAGRSAIAPIRQWEAAGVPLPPAGEVADLDARELVADRKVHKVLRRTDLLGLYAAGKAIEDASLVAYRATLDPVAAATYSDRTAVFVGSGGGTYQSQYDFFPLLTAVQGDLRAFGGALNATINPMWLLRTLPNNVLCHIGIRYGFKGANACVTHHSVSGTLAIAEAAAALRAGEAERAVAVGHDAPIEPQTILYYQRLGLLAADAIRPFDGARSGSLLGEGAAAVVLETAAAAAARGAKVLGEFLGSACTAEAEGLLAIRADGDGLARAITLALDDAGLQPADVGMIVAHGNGTRASDAVEAAVIQRLFGRTPPPVTAFKWAFGHLLAASGVVDAVLALMALRRGIVPGIATLCHRDPEFGGLPVSAGPQLPRSNVALVISRGFAGTTVVLLVRA